MTSPITVLALGTDRTLLSELDGIVSHAGMRSMVVHSLPVALARVKRAGDVDVVIVDCEPGSGAWRRVLSNLCEPCGIPLIVTSRIADETLWSEVLHYGGFDVLARPLQAEEVRRVIESAVRSRTRPARYLKPLAMHA